MKNDDKMPLSMRNYLYMVISFVIVIIGFMLMSGGGSSSPDEYNPEALFSFRRITLSVFFVLFGFGAMVYSIMKRWN